MNIPPDVEADFGDCLFRVPEEDVPQELLQERLPKLEKCLRAENAYCDLDGNLKNTGRKERGRTMFNKDEEPLWCEDCKHFCNADMGGEGECDLDNHSTWYSCPACKRFKEKG